MAAQTDKPRRVRVIGNSGAGKTTFARALAVRLGLPRAELDEIFWDANWTQRPVEEGRTRLAAFLDGPGTAGWVVDGNWNSRVGDLLDSADAIVWLDYSRWVVMSRVIWRTLSRLVSRRELWHGNRERPSHLFRRDPAENIILWAWTQQPVYHAQYAELAQHDSRVVRLANPRAAQRWLAGVGCEVQSRSSWRTKSTKAADLAS